MTKVLLVSTYELGHQPLHVASPAGALREAGHDVRCLDVSVEPWDPALVEWADRVAFSVPMHTAMRLAMRGAHAVRRYGKRVCFYGLYAPVSKDLTLGRVADRVIAGEYESGLLAWASGVESTGATLSLGHDKFTRPARDLLPPLERYAHLAIGGDERPVGYVEASHGCAHLCRHCPLPVVYDSRIRLVPREVVLDDIAQLASMGARHVTFGDPDFLNGWRHSLRVVQEMHERFPDLTFDCTTKVEHVLEHRDRWPELAASGCLFVVSAFECVNDEILRVLDKGHTAEQAAEAVRLLRGHGIEPRPSWMPFTPWTTVQDVRDILEFVVRHDLVGNVDPVQYSIRLLLPEGSLLLGIPEIAPYLGPYDADALTYTWRAADPQTQDLQRELTRIVQDDAPILDTFRRVWDAAVGRELTLAGVEGKPRLTEPWFC